MKSAILILVALVLISIPVYGVDDITSLSQQQLVLDNMSLNPLAFTENHGQWDDQVKFKANAGGATMWFTSEGVVYQFVKSVSKEDTSADFSLLPQDKFKQEPNSVEQLVIKSSFVGANPNPDISGEVAMEYKCNYFIGNDPKEWHTDVPNYQAVYFKEIYTGIDLKYYGNSKQVEYDFIVSPGTDYTQIQIQYEGAKNLSVNSSGELVIETAWGNMIEQKPVVYQMQGSNRQVIKGRYILDNGTFSFSLDDNYNPNLELVIDPVLVYGTYLGGSQYEWGYGIALDVLGCAYVTGLSNSTDFPTQDPYQEDQFGNDVVITKLSSTGNNLIYSTYFGGSSEDRGWDIAVDNFGCAYVVGDTKSDNIPTVNPYQTDQVGSDAFVIKLSGMGNSLIYSTYLGGNGYDLAHSITIDNSLCAYIVGETESIDFPSVNPYQPTHHGNSDAFVSKLSNAGDSLIYSTFLGGAGNDIAFSIAIDTAECSYVTGDTYSNDYPTMNPYQIDPGVYDIFITKLNKSGDNIIYSTYLGGSSSQTGYDIAVDASGCAYVTGQTYSTDFPTVNPYQSTYRGNCDIFISKLSSTGDSLIYSSYLGGNDNEVARGIDLDPVGHAYITGQTRSIDFPTINSFQTAQPFQNAIVTMFSTGGESLIYSTYLGGNSDERGWGIAIDFKGCAYVVGETWSDDFPTENEYQTKQGFTDVFVIKFGSEVQYICGDANYDGFVNVSDAVWVINYVFIGGQAPYPIESGDPNCDGKCNVSDAVYIINYVFTSGHHPCDPNGDGIPDC